MTDTAGRVAEYHRFPGYNVLDKRNTPSWNEQTRRVIEERLALPDEPRFLDQAEWRTLRAVCDRILPQPPERRPPVPLAALVDHQLTTNRGDGFRQADMPPLREAWRQGLKAIEAEARLEGAAFHELPSERQDALLRRVQQGEVRAQEWSGLPARTFFKARLLHDVAGAYYTHPTAWNEIGFGGPASPRGYVRMGFDRYDPWEAKENPPKDRTGHKP